MRRFYWLAQMYHQDPRLHRNDAAVRAELQGELELEGEDLLVRPSAARPN